ncbi:hypothetical protein BJ165DRAFT_1399875 [Panaeolus papilionaceus]|nr:hypothetical protein BJ165DRAFT_1399875 [Panaeolus papilionaceus]
MYRRETPSPIFDAPEFPVLRRMRPLPKRRRTAAGANNGHDHISLNHQQSGGMPTASFTTHGAAATALIQQGLGVLHQHQQQHGQSALEMLASATTGLPMEEFLNGTEVISARIALQNYYMPILGTVQNFLAANAAAIATGTNPNSNTAGEDSSDPNQPTHTNTTANTAAAAAAAALAAITNAGTTRAGQLPVSLADLDSIEFGVHFAAAAAAAAAAGVAMGGLGGMDFGFPSTNMGHAPTSMPAPVPTHSRDDEDPRGDADYLDHMQQPGNTKKRKVPANVGGSPRGSGRRAEGGEDEGSLGTYANDGHDGGQGSEHPSRDRNGDEYNCDPQDRQASDSTSTSSTPGTSYPPAPFPGQLSLVVKKRGKMTAVTLAGLQHKEILKSRKRQLAAVMGALSHGDTLALDQALSASLPLLSGFGSMVNGSGNGVGDEEERKPRLRKSKRWSVRLARAMKVLLETPERRIPHPDAMPFPSAPFNFMCASDTAERLIATKAEAASLRNQFERELKRQANKAAKLVGQAGGNKAMARAGGGKAKRERLERERMARVENAQSQKVKVEVTATTTAKISNPPAIPTPPILSLPGGGKSKAKKKKRSALANASNPHHLRNYVPSRLPNSGPSGGDGGNSTGAQHANLIWPLPIQFLSAEVPPRRRNSPGHEDGSVNQSSKNTRSTTNGPPMSHIQPVDEWICAFCEYELFYGSDAAYRRGVRNRKKILKRRRRARERAAAAARGARAASAKGAPPAPLQDEQDFDEYEDVEADVEEYGSAPAQNVGRVKAGPDKDGAVGLG